MSHLKKVQLRQHLFELLSDPVPINNWSSLSVYQSVRQVFAKPKQVEVCSKFVKVLGFLFFALREGSKLQAPVSDHNVPFPCVDQIDLY